MDIKGINKDFIDIKTFASCLLCLLLGSYFPNAVSNERDILTLDETCIINILNRTVNVQANGTWFVNNVPSTMGQVRARATCSREGNTVSGETDYFNIEENKLSGASIFYMAQTNQSPSKLEFQSFGTKHYTINEDGTLVFDETQEIVYLSSISETYQVQVKAFYSDGSEVDVTEQSSGINYASTNPVVASVGSGGLVNPKSSGITSIIARKDGVVVIIRVEVAIGNDADGDGLPDDYEVENGLNPNDPIDAFEDPDSDGLSTLEEFNAGTNPFDSDTDGDGVSDSEELSEGEDGFITDPLLEDTDGDGLSDGVEIAVNTDPTDENDFDLTAALVSINSTPSTVVMTFNGIDSESSTQLTIRGVLIDDSVVDLTSKDSGTTYVSSDLSIASFGIDDGVVFAGAAGNAVVTVSNGDFSVEIDVTVEQFEAVALSAVAIPGYANNVDINGDYAYIAAGIEGLQVVDVSDRENPAVVASLDTDGTAIDIKVVGSRAFIADGDAGLKIIDITDPLAPELEGSLDTAGITQDLAVDFDYAYLANGDSGIEIVDISSPDQPISVSTLSGLGTVKGIDIENQQVVVVSSTALILIDTTDKSSPIRLGSININSAKDVVVDGGFAHVAAYSSGFRVVDLSDSTKPVIVAGNARIAPRDIALTRDFAFYAEQLFPNVVAFVNIFDPAEAVFQGTINLSSLGDYAGTGIALDASYAYITEESFVVRQDYGSSGTTKLFIAQYRDINDNNGVPPTIELISPTDGQVVVEGRRLNISANASDDVVVAQVNFSINDEVVYRDSSEPYLFAYKVPGELSELNVFAEAVDLGGNTNSTDVVTVEIQPDSDDDGLGDTEETETYSTDPANPDSDDDGLLDGEEIAIGTDPNNKDSDDDGLEDKSEVDNETDPLNPDITPPSVVSIDPADGAEDIPENSPISIMINEALLGKSVTQATVVVTQDDSTVVPGNVQLASEGLELLFSPASLMNDFTLHTVSISAARDLAGNIIADTQFTFTTGNLVDITNPSVLDVTPNANAVDVPVNARLTVILSEPIDPSTITDDTVYVLDNSTGQVVPGVVSLSVDKSVISFVPNAALLVGRQHRLTLTTGILDLFGNNLPTSYFYFTTALTPDAQAPTLALSTVIEGDLDIPVNARFSLSFDEAINGLSVNNIRLLLDGNDVSVTRTIESDRSTVTLTPSALLDATSTFSIFIDGIEDLSGNLIENSQTISFTTSDVSDTELGAYVQFSPAHSSTNVPLNTDLTVRVNERLDPASINESSFYLYDHLTARKVVGDWVLSEGGQRISFVPAADLDAKRTYTLYWSYNAFLTDYAGNRVGAYHYTTFTTGEASLNSPLVVDPNFSDGSIDVPVNPRIRITSDVSFNRLCIDDTTATLVEGANTTNLNVTLTDAFTLTLTSDDLLAASTEYTLTLNGVCDYAANLLTDYQLVFTTSADAEADTQAPNMVSIVPADESVDIELDSTIVMIFDEELDPVSMDGVTVSVTGFSGSLAGTLSLSDGTITFTPLNPFPGDATINISIYYITDIAGNVRHFGNHFNFSTVPATDNTAPHVIAISPEDGSLDILNTESVVVTFNESLDASTVDNNSFLFWSNGTLIRPSIFRSTDNRTITLTSTLPVGSLVTLIITDDVKDLSGNQMLDFTSSFTTSLGRDLTRPSVTWQYPSNGSTVVTDKIILYVNEKIDTTTLDESLFVAQDGVLINGDVTVLSDSHVIEFTPDAAFTSNALIHIYLKSTVTDLSGNALNNYQSYFRVYNDDALIGTRHYPIAYSPSNGSSDNSLNPLIMVSYSEPLDESTVNSENIILRDPDNTVIDSVVSLSTNGSLVSVIPQNNLAPGTQYSLFMSNAILDTDGDTQWTNYSMYFVTGESAVEDNQAPALQTVSPPNGSVDVPMNVSYHARFNEALNPLSFPVGEGVSVQFSANNHEVRYIPADILLPANSSVTEMLPQIADRSGNLISGSTSFTTASDLDFVRADVKEVSPFYGDNTVPVNAVLSVKMTKEIDPASIHTDSIYIRDNATGLTVPADVNLAPDGRTLSIIPTEVLKVGRQHILYVYGMSDLAGNVAINRAYYFNTVFETDNEAPTISLMSLSDGSINVPMNAQIHINISEAINPVGMAISGQVRLQDSGDVDVPFNFSVDSTYTKLTIIPIDILEPDSAYTLTISGISDRAGNVLVADEIVNFNTANGLDVLIGSYIQFSPAHSSINVPLNTEISVRFDERIDPTSITSNSFYLYDAVTARSVSGDWSLSENDQRLSFVPDTALEAKRSYTLYWSYNAFLTDLAGNRVGAYHFTSFTTGDVSLSSPLNIDPNFVDGSLDIPVNPRLILHSDTPFSRICIDDATASFVEGLNTTSVNISLTDANTLTLSIPDILAASTTYTLTLSGACDYAGILLPDYEMTFTTSAADIADTLAPSMVSIVPADESVDVDPSSSIVVTIDENIDPISFNGFTVSIDGLTGTVAGDLSLSDNVITFTPLNPFPGEAVVRASIYYVYDLAGNVRHFGNHFNFTTAASTDTTAPEIISVSPADGSLDVRTNESVVITFNESIDYSTINNNSFVYWTNGSLIRPSVLRSSDNRTVTLNSTLPAGSPITLIVTDDVKDLSGNKLVDFTSSFSTSVGVDNIRPSVTVQYPVNGSTASINKILLYVNDKVDTSTIETGLYVAQDGVLIDGTITALADDYAIEFIPAESFTPGALIHVYLQSTVTDLSGNALHNYQSSFTVYDEDTLFGTKHYPTAYSPVSGATEVTLNPVIQISYTEALDDTTVNASNLVLRDPDNNEVTSEITLSSNGRVVSVAPQELLAVDTRYTLTLSNAILDTDGDPQWTNYSMYFTTGAAAVEDNQAPSLVTISPANGAVDVPLNVSFHARFDEALSPLSFPEEEGLFVQFTSNNQEVRYTPIDILLAENTEITEDLPPVTDFSGNAVSVSTTFTTSDYIDLTNSDVRYISPFANETGVPVNAVVVLEMTEAIDPSSINGSSLQLYNVTSAADVPATVNQSTDGKTLTLVPDEVFDTSSQHRVITNGLKDLSGNSTTYRVYYFTTSELNDDTAPTVSIIGINDGQTDLPTNVNLNIRFSEAIDIIASLQQSQIIVKDSDTNVVPFKVQFNNDQSLVTLSPLSVLAPLSTYSLDISGILDRAQNVLESDVNYTFTTGSYSDIKEGKVLYRTPLSVDTNIPLNVVVEIKVDTPVDPATVTIETFRLYDYTNGNTIAGSLSLSEGDTRITFTPDVDLIANSRYYISMSNNYANPGIKFVRDFGGNIIGYNHTSYGDTYFTTGESADEAAPTLQISGIVDGKTDMPLNTRLSLHFDERIKTSSIINGVRLYDSGNALIETTQSVSSTRLTVTLIPDVNLDANTSYHYEVGGVTDLADNAVTEASASFTTGDVVDDIDGTVIYRTPLSQDTNIPLNATVDMKLSERVDPATVTEETFRVYDYTNGQIIPGSLSLSEGDTRITFTPDEELVANSRYYISMSNNYANPGAKFVKDLAGNNVGYHHTSYGDSYFTTGESVDETLPVVQITGIEDGRTDMPLNTQLTLHFDERIKTNSIISGISLFDASDNLIASTQSISSTRLTATLIPDEVLLANTTYHYEVTSVTDLADNAIADTITGSFTTGSILDETDGTVLTRSPLSQDTNIPLNATVDLKLSERVDPATVTEETFRLYDYTNGLTVPGTYSLSEGDTRIIFTPDEALAANSRFYISMSNNYANPGSKFVKDLAGNNIGYHHTTYGDTYFTTGDTSDEVLPVLDILGLPDGITDVPLNGQVSLHFDERIKNNSMLNGFILYDSGDAVVPSTINISSTRFTVTLVPDADLSASETYHYEVTNITDLVDNTIAAPISASFTTGTASDVTEGSVLTRSPTHQATDIAVDAVIDMELSERVDAATVTAETFRVYDYTNGLFVAGTLSLSDGDTRIIFTPDENLAANSRIYISMSNNYANPGAKFVKDLAGNNVGYHHTTYGDTYFNTVAP